MSKVIDVTLLHNFFQGAGNFNDVGAENVGDD